MGRERERERESGRERKKERQSLNIYEVVLKDQFTFTHTISYIYTY